jgi:hypothetical protein
MIVLSRQRWPRFLGGLASSPFKLLLLVTAIIALTSAMTGDRVVVWLIGIFATLGCLVANVIADYVKGVASEWRPRWSLRGMLAVITCLAVISASLVQAPFQARFALSRDAINSLAERVMRGEHVETPCWTGTFLVRQVEIHTRSEQPPRDGTQPADPNPHVFLWTDLSPGGRTGFARGIVPNHGRYWLQRRLDDRWWFVVED